MEKPRIVCCWNSELRNNGTGCRVFDALRRGLGFADLKRYSRPAIFPESEEYDLIISVDDGRDDIQFDPPHPNVYWAIDTHLGFDTRLNRARNFDYVFCAQQEGVERMQEAGIEQVYWLPLACSPPIDGIGPDPDLSEMRVHSERDRITEGKGLDKLYDVVFVGFLNQGAGEGSHNRVEYLDRLFKEFPNSWMAFQRFFEDQATRYLWGRLGFNISIKNDLNMRWFEVMSTGTCLFTNTDVEGWRELGFVDGEHFIGYHGMDDMIEKTHWALEHPIEREQIAQQGHDFVRKYHTYTHRMAYLLDVCGSMPLTGTTPVEVND